MGWSEIITTNTGSRDRAGRLRLVRTFKVYGGVSASQIRTDPASVLNDDGQGLPSYGSSYPGEGAATLDAYDVAAEQEIFIAQALYSNDRFWKSAPHRDLTDPNLFRYAGTAGRDEVDIPYIRKVKSRLPAKPGDVPPEIVTWEVETISPTVRTERIQIVVNKQFFSFADREFIGSQTGKLHDIFPGTESPWCLFEGADYHELDILIPTTQITYTWRREFPIYKIDPDTGEDLFPDFPIESDSLHIGFWPVTDADQVIRPPFNVIVWHPRPDLPSVPWKFIRTLAYRKSPGGHFGLPGIDGRK